MGIVLLVKLRAYSGLQWNVIAATGQRVIEGLQNSKESNQRVTSGSISPICSVVVNKI